MKGLCVCFAIVSFGGLPLASWRAATAAPAARPWSADSFQGDFNSDGQLSVSDAVYLLNFLFRGGKDLPRLRTARSSLPSTGQRHCWSATGELLSPCPGPGEDDYGQDAQFGVGYEHDFELIKDDPEDPSTWITVDHAMGFMWTYTDDGERRSWLDALHAVEELELGGFTDWRMPNLFELVSIINTGAILDENRNDVFQVVTYGEFFSVARELYWTSTTCASNTRRVYAVSFDEGRVLCPDKGLGSVIDIRLPSLWIRSTDSSPPIETVQGDADGDGDLDVNDALFLLDSLFAAGDPLPMLRTSDRSLPSTGQMNCFVMRGMLQAPCPQPGTPGYGQDGHFRLGYAHEFELVRDRPEDASTWFTIDYATGLMWSYGADTQRRNWRDALRHAAELELGGFTDWRLPTMLELVTLLNAGQSVDEDGNLVFRRTSSYEGVFSLFPGPDYWTATTCSFRASRTYTLNFFSGGLKCSDKGKDFFPSLPVRSLGPAEGSTP